MPTRGEQKSLLSRAVAILARREMSRADLRRRLQRHLPLDADAGEIERVLDELQRRQLLSDERFANALLRTRAARYGDARLRFDLRQHGVGDTDAAGALAAERVPELARAHALWKRRFGALPADRAERAKQGRFLQARGFSDDTIRRVLRGAVDDA